MDRQIPGVGEEGAGQNGSSRCQVNNKKNEPLFARRSVDSVPACVMNAVLYYRCDGMQHRAMRNVFGQGPRHDAGTEENNSSGKLQS